MGQGRGRPHTQPRGDIFETRATNVALARCDDPERFDLAVRQSLEGFHERNESSAVYIGISNY